MASVACWVSSAISATAKHGELGLFLHLASVWVQMLEAAMPELCISISV